MKKIFNLLKGKSKSFSFKKFLVLFGSAFIVNFFSNFFGSALLITSLLYLTTKGIIPKFINIGSKIVNFIKQKCNNSKEKKKNKKRKSLTLFKFKKKKAEKEEVKEAKKEKKTIPNVIKNFKLVGTDKFKLNLKVKKDINGCKIVNGSYRISGNDIIDNKTYITIPIRNQENEVKEHSQKTYVKTK